MSTHLKKIKITLLLLLLLVSGASCSSSSTTKTENQNTNEIVIGFSQLGNESAWREKNTQSILEAAKKAHYKVIFKDGLQKQENQIKHLRAFIASQVDVIILSPIVETGWENVLQEAQDAGIPVILDDRGIQADPQLYSALVGTNGFEEGQKAANFLLKKFKDSGEPVKIVEIVGTPGSSSAEQRAQGFRQELQSNPKFQLVASENGDYMLSKGAESIAKIDKNVDLHEIDAIFSHNDEMTLGILKYLAKTDIKAGQDIVIVSVDAQQDVVDLVKQGVVNCTVECNPNAGPKIIATINHLLNGGSLEKEYFLEEQVFTEETDFSNLPPRGY